MTEQNTAEATETEAAEPEATEAVEESTEAATADEGEKALGDAGKKALDAMKAKWKAAEKKATENAEKAAEADALRAKLDGKEAEYVEQQKNREVEAAALAKANERILKAEVRAQAATKLADPTDALRFIDLSEFEVDSDGAVDGAAIAAAIDDLVTTKPYLSAQGGKRFQGTADGGARNDASKPSQLTPEQISRMSPEEVDAAYQNGQFDSALGRK